MYQYQYYSLRKYEIAWPDTEHSTNCWSMGRQISDCVKYPSPVLYCKPFNGSFLISTLTYHDPSIDLMVCYPPEDSVSIVYQRTCPVYVKNLYFPIGWCNSNSVLIGQNRFSWGETPTGRYHIADHCFTIKWTVLSNSEQDQRNNLLFALFC